MSKIKQVLEESEKLFDDRVKKLNNSEIKEGESSVSYFGYRVKVGNEVFTVIDFGNIKSHISQQNQALIDNIKDWCKARCESNIKTYGTDKWNGDLEDLIKYLSE
jgi:hypothetical protein